MRTARSSGFLWSTAIAFCLAIFSPHALATVITTTGTIGQGDDYTGTFGGTAGSDYDLAGDTFTLTTTLDPTAAANQNLTSYSNSFYGPGVSFTVSLTINGTTQTYAVPTAFGSSSYLQNLATQLGSGNGWDEASFYVQGYDSQGIDLAVHQYLETLTALQLDLSFDQSFSDSPASNDYAYTYFDYATPDGGTSFEANIQPNSTSGWISDFSMNGSATSVPEPGTLALMSLALAGLGLMRRRRAS